MAKYAFIDTGGLLRVTKYEKTAKDKSLSGKYYKTNVAAAYGFPVDDEGKQYLLFSDKDEKNNREIPEELAALYRKCRD